MKRIVPPFISLAALAMLSACGDDVTEVIEVHQDGIAVLEAGKAIGTCDAKNAGDMLYVTDSAEVYFCDGKAWRPTKGADGADGVDGKAGKDGVDGKPGEPGKAGDKGADGTSCSAKSVKNEAGLKGVEVSCGENVIDTVWSGKDGGKGNAGKDGAGCMLEDDGDGMLTITCGEGDDATEAHIFKAMCGTKPYDPAKSFCSDGDLYSCDDKPFDPKKQFCKQNSSVEDYGWLTDPRDNQVYKTVKICSDDETSCQTWMAENLNYSLNPGEQSWCYGDDDSNCDKYGRLYIWVAAVGKSEEECRYNKNCDLSDVMNEMGEVRGVCPEGWHLPSYEEFENLFKYIDSSVESGDGRSSIAGKYLKSENGWNSGGNGEDSYGFSALPAGGRYDLADKFYFVGEDAYFWSVTQDEEDNLFAYSMNLHFSNEFAKLSVDNKHSAFSVRCLQKN